jgi:glycosyltransferase involved in cell wall biosynthesis
MGDRPHLLAKLKSSLEKQTYRNFEWIIINQNEHPEFNGGLSKARNFGIEQATGDVLGFPDDDVWYGADLLRAVAAMLVKPEVDGVSFRVVDEKGKCSAGWMSRKRKIVDKANVWHTIVSGSIFIKREKVGDLRFDERLGAGSGTCFGSGEETDFVLSLLARNAKVAYDGSKCIFHPAPSGRNGMSKGWLYGNGYGMVLRRHHYSLARLFWAVGVQMIRALQSLLFFDLRKATFHCAMSFGRLFGYVRNREGNSLRRLCQCCNVSC